MIRLLSWNVRSLRDSRADVVAVIRAAEADVVCLQESPRLLAAWHARRLARDCDLKVASAGAPVGALSILVAPHVRAVAAMRVGLPLTPGLHRRGLVRAIVEHDGMRLQVGSLHLGLREEERVRHAQRVVALTREVSVPAVLAGDVNDVEDSGTWSILAAHYDDAWTVAGEGDGRTFSAQRPRRRIDAVFVDRRLDVRACRVIDTPAVERASDHRPLVVEIAPRPPE